MQKIVVITRSNQNTGAQVLVEAATKVGFQAERVFAATPNMQELLVADLVIARATEETLDDVSALLVACEKAGIRVSPGSKQLIAGFNKCLAYELLAKQEVPQPATVVCLKGHALQLPAFSPPYVLKPAIGNRGNGVVKLKNDTELRETSNQEFYTNSGYVVQEYIEAGGVDKRLFVIGDSVVAAMERSSKDGDFRSNIAQGGKAKAYQWTDKEALVAVRAVRALGLDFGGVDILSSPRGPLVLEVNPSPGFKVGEYYGVNVPEYVVKYLVSKDKDD